MEAVLLVCHGSRVKEGCEQAKDFAQKCLGDYDVAIMEISFLELASPSIEEGFERCIERGATSVAVVPVILLSAGHVKEDIPRELERIQSKHSHIKTSLGCPFGVHTAITQLLQDRIQSAVKEVQKKSKILLVGRGSSDPDVKQQLVAIASNLALTYPGSDVEPCYLTAAEPSYEEALQHSSRDSYEQIIVVPYLLFTGILLKGMRQTIGKMQKQEGQEIILCESLGYHPSLKEIMTERTNETMKLVTA